MRPVWVLIALMMEMSWAWADDWPQWRGPNRDGVWRESGIVETLPAELPRAWSTEIGMGYAGPAVAGGKVYVMDRQLGSDVENPANPFFKEKVTGNERVLCLDAATGEILWKHVYDCAYTISYAYGPRVTPTVDGDRLYTVGAMGDFWCLESATGKVVWSKSYVKDFGTEINTWGMSAHPLVDETSVYLLVGGDAGFVALDKATGQERWRALKMNDPGYAPPMFIDEGGRRQLIVWTPEAINSLDPKTGEVLWQQTYKVKQGLSISQPIFDPSRHLLFVTSFYQGPMMLELAADKPEAKLLWRGSSKSEIRTDGLHSIMATPLFDDGHVYGVCSYGQLRCLEAQTGKRVWETFDATGEGRWWNAFLVQHEDKTVLANEQGDLIFAKLDPSGYKELSRGKLIEPTGEAQRRKIVWSHPAFADRAVFARNDVRIVRANLAK
jgi:outer membrane protein assembly factor BamB